MLILKLDRTFYTETRVNPLVTLPDSEASVFSADPYSGSSVREQTVDISDIQLVSLSADLIVLAKPFLYLRTPLAVERVLFYDGCAALLCSLCFL